jgi:hypothetical protein
MASENDHQGRVRQDRVRMTEARKALHVREFVRHDDEAGWRRGRERLGRLVRVRTTVAGTPSVVSQYASFPPVSVFWSTTRAVGTIGALRAGIAPGLIPRLPMMRIAAFCVGGLALALFVFILVHWARGGVPRRYRRHGWNRDREAYDHSRGMSGRDHAEDAISNSGSMNLSRNSRCSCGSGRKFKRCCGNGRIARRGLL